MISLFLAVQSYALVAEVCQISTLTYIHSSLLQLNSRNCTGVSWAACAAVGSSAAQTSALDGDISCLWRSPLNWHTQLWQSGLHKNLQALEAGSVPMCLSIQPHTKCECIRVVLSELDQIGLFVSDGLCQTCRMFHLEMCVTSLKKLNNFENKITHT
jgi:hypothetical protein